MVSANDADGRSLLHNHERHGVEQEFAMSSSYQLNTRQSYGADGMSQPVSTLNLFFDLKSTMNPNVE